MPNMRQVYDAFLAADAAGDTESAQVLADYIRQQSMSPEELMAGVKPQYTTGEAFSKGVKRGFKQLGSTFGDIIPAMVGKGLGFEDYAKQQMQEAAQTQEEIAQSYAPQFQSYKDVQGFGDAGKFAVETIAEQIPNILTSLIPGVGAEAIAARAALGRIGTGLATQAAERGLAGEAAKSYVTQGLRAAAQSPELLAARSTGQNLGVYLGSYAQAAPEVFQNIYDKTGDMSVGASLIAGAGSAALDSVLPARVLNKLTGPLKVGVVENLLAKSGMQEGLRRKVTAELLTGMGA